MLTEVKDALFQYSVQSGDNRRYRSHCQFRASCPCSVAHSLSGVQLSSSSLSSFLRRAQRLLSLFSPWHFTKQQVVSGVAPSLLHWSPAPHSSQVTRDWLEKPSMKS
jgi:hypothetical protein